MALAASSARACTRLRQWPRWQSAERATAYVARGGELLLDALFTGGPRIALPRIVSATPPRMTFHFADSGALEAERFGAKFGLRAPTADSERCADGTVDIALVPGVAFTATGQRLGQGGGYYDAWLPTAPRALRVGVAHSFQVVDALPTDTLDQAMDFLLTSDGLWPTGARPLPHSLNPTAQTKEPS